MTPNSESLTIVITGIRNAGKSSLINNIFEKEIAIVSDYPGTTTDPVIKKIELSSLGACTVIDTAGIDDSEITGDIGKKRIEKSLEYIKKAHILIFTTPGDKPLVDSEQKLLETLKNIDTPIIVAKTYSEKKNDISKEKIISTYQTVDIDNITGKGINLLREKIIALKPKIQYEITPLEGLVKEGDNILLVTPIDLAAPKGRLILPQVETIRDALDRDCSVMIVKERELYDFYNNLAVKPDLVITDSQVFHKVKADLPDSQKLTSFSILFARKKGELDVFLEGLNKLKTINDNSKILVMESCNHHRQADDIGTVKIPRLFKQLVNNKADFEFSRTLPENIEEFDLVIHCAACMTTKKDMVNRINAIREKKVAITNYGLFLGWANGLIPRAIEML